MEFGSTGQITSGTVKCLIVGEYGSGKSTLMRRVEDDEFVHTSPTVGVEFHVFSIPRLVPKITVWNLAGASRFQEILRLYYKGAQVIFIVLDATRKSDVEQWVAKSRELAPDARLVLIFTKIDLPSVYSSEEMESLRKFYNLHDSFAVSSKEMTKDEILSLLACQFVGIEAKPAITIDPIQPNRDCCCLC